MHIITEVGVSSHVLVRVLVCVSVRKCVCVCARACVGVLLCALC